MNKALAMAFLVGGVLLLIFGIGAADSLSSETSELLSGAPSNKAIWLMVGGVAAALVGLFSLVRTRSA